MKLASDLRRRELIMQSVAGAAVYMYSVSEARLKRCSLVMGFVEDRRANEMIQIKDVMYGKGETTGINKRNYKKNYADKNSKQ